MRTVNLKGVWDVGSLTASFRDIRRSPLVVDLDRGETEGPELGFSRESTCCEQRCKRLSLKGRSSKVFLSAEERHLEQCRRMS